MMDVPSCPALEIDWGVSAELSDSDYDADDFDEELQSIYFSDRVPKLQFRKDVSVARWDGKKGMAEVIVRKGRMWSTTGIVRKEKLFCHIEEVMFMVERGALLLLEGDVSLSMKDIYSLLAEENYGCTWDYYQAYCHLKGFGYIVGRHNCPWTLKSEEYKPMSCCLSSPEGQSHDYEDDAVRVDLSNSDDCFQSNSTMITSEDKHTFLKDGECCSNFHQATSHTPNDSLVEEGLSLACALENLSISKGSSDFEHYQGLKLVFDVYLPNTKFKKSAPGNPEFILCIARGILKPTVIIWVRHRFMGVTVTFMEILPQRFIQGWVRFSWSGIYSSRGPGGECSESSLSQVGLHHVSHGLLIVKFKA